SALRRRARACPGVRDVRCILRAARPAPELVGASDHGVLSPGPHGGFWRAGGGAGPGPGPGGRGMIGRDAAWTAPPLWFCGFRPFFVLTSAGAVGFLAVWLLLLGGAGLSGWQPPGGVLSWHAHE